MQGCALRINVSQLQRSTALQRIRIADQTLLAQRVDLGQAVSSLRGQQLIAVLGGRDLGINAVRPRRRRSCAQRLDLFVALVGQGLFCLRLLSLGGFELCRVKVR